VLDLDPAHLFNQALDAMEAEDLEKAERFLRSVMLQDPSDTESLLMLVGILRDSDRGEECMQMLVGHLEHATDVYGALVELGDLRLSNNQPEAAAEVLRMALELRPNGWEALFQLGNAFSDVGAYPEAVKTYEIALASNPFGSDIWYNLARSRTEIEDIEGATKAWRTYLRCAPDSAERREIELIISRLEQLLE